MTIKLSYALLSVSLFLAGTCICQTGLPVGFAPGEEKQALFIPGPLPAPSPNVSFIPPHGSHIRVAAEWEEIQGLTISWTDYPDILAGIVQAAQTETQVYIICGNSCGSGSDSNTVKSYLAGLHIPLINLHFIYAPCNSVWIRDYGQNSVYTNDVDSLIFVEWKYNRPRPADDSVPRSIGRYMHIPDYEMSQAPNTLIATGGNWMSDGLGTAFGSKLTLNENTNYTVSQIDQLAHNWMGITRYVHIATLPYDGIHHIDMHMKLLDEETLLVGQYPLNTADGPQIEANIQYILSTYTSVFGTPYKIVRIPQPPDQLNGNTYPDNGGSYLTYANATFINKTVIIPQYYAQYDTTAMRIWKETLPGYRIYGINSNNSISASGSLHCMTHSIGVADPLLISHQPLPNTSNTTTPYQANAKILHRSGILTASLYYRTDTTKPYVAVAMSLSNAGTGTWTGYLPAQPGGTRVYYYIEAHAVSGKSQVRPMPAPKAYWKFDVLGAPTGVTEPGLVSFRAAYPNPSHGITCIPVLSPRDVKGSLRLLDISGREIRLLFEGEIPAGEKNFFLDSFDLPAGAYLLLLSTEAGTAVQKLMIR